MTRMYIHLGTDEVCSSQTKISFTNKKEVLTHTTAWTSLENMLHEEAKHK